MRRVKKSDYAVGEWHDKRAATQPAKKAAMAGSQFGGCA
jgi:hypothetical protein